MFFHKIITIKGICENKFPMKIIRVNKPNKTHEFNLKGEHHISRRFLN